MSEVLHEIGKIVAAHSRQAYFVGGAVRDLLLGAPVKDVDVALEGDPLAVGRMIARTHPYHGHVFWLREEERVVRVVLPEYGFHIDLSPLQGSIEADLRARDLTINALAIPASEGLSLGAPVLDPTGGREDLRARLLRFPAPDAARRDPLRVLRVLRFRWKLRFSIEPETLARMRESVPLLEAVSAERVRDELFQILALREAAEGLTEAIELGLMPRLVGRAVEIGSEDGMPVPAARVRDLTAILEDAPPELLGLMDTVLAAPRRRREVLLWAGALQPLTPPVDPDAAARHLALSNEERRLIVRALACVDVARELARRWPAPGRQRLRLFREAGAAAPEAVLLAGAVEGWNPAFAELLEEALRHLFWPEPPLLSGFEVMQATGLEPGPEIGRLLREVEEARADGLIRTREEAVRWLRERARSSRSP